jgi:MoaA/NifB/PqqE/SkfB family radical SAM enzyme
MKKIQKYISYMIAILKGRITQKRIPVFVTICLTNRCNLRCIYCYENYYSRDFPDPSANDIFSLLDDLAASGTKYISLNGGEVLLRDDLPLIINKVNEKGMLCHLSTNGLLANKHIDVLRQVDSLAISMDGRKEENDINRGNGVYDKLIDTFDILKENKITFHTHTVLTRNNVNAIEDMLAIAVRYNCKAQFSILRINDSTAKNISLSDDEIRNTLRKLIELKHKGYPAFFSENAYRDALNWPMSFDVPFVMGNNIPGHTKCFLKDFSCHIEANGFVYPCVPLVNKINALNYKTVGFQKAWDNLEKCKCNACYSVCCNDLNRIFMLDPCSIFNAVGIVKNRFSRPRL